MLSRGSLQLRGRLRWRWRRLRAILANGPGTVGRLPVVFGNAIPKSGSKLLFNILRGFQEIAPFVDSGLSEIKPYRDGRPTPQAWINAQLEALRPGDIRLGYLAWSTETEARLCRPRWAVYQMVRDPRDVIVSQIFYATDMHQGHALRQYLGSLPDMETRIETMVRGIPDGPFQRANVRQQFDRFIPWMKHADVCLVRYEQLIREPDETLMSMLAHARARGLTLNETDSALAARLRQRMSPAASETFRKGGAGGWRQHFTTRNRGTFEAVAGDLLTTLGYER